MDTNVLDTAIKIGEVRIHDTHHAVALPQKRRRTASDTPLQAVEELGDVLNGLTGGKSLLKFLRSVMDMLRKQLVRHSGQRVIGVRQQVEVDAKRQFNGRMAEALADGLD